MFRLDVIYSVHLSGCKFVSQHFHDEEVSGLL
jgi:hypothetical protein